MWINEFGANRSQDEIIAIFDQRQFTGIENETNIWIFEVEFLMISGFGPRNFTR